MNLREEEIFEFMLGQCTAGGASAPTKTTTTTDDRRHRCKTHTHIMSRSVALGAHVRKLVHANRTATHGMTISV